jgi:hypothetical protein
VTLSLPRSLEFYHRGRRTPTFGNEGQFRLSDGSMARIGGRAELKFDRICPGPNSIVVAFLRCQRELTLYFLIG